MVSGMSVYMSHYMSSLKGETQSVGQGVVVGTFFLFYCIIHSGKRDREKSKVMRWIESHIKINL